jgi:hypothetical protein
MLAVEVKLIAGGGSRTGEASICRNICKRLRADAGPETISVQIASHGYQRYVRVTRVCVPAGIVQL